MFNLIHNNSAKLSFKAIIIGLAVVLVLGSLALTVTEKTLKDTPKNTESNSQLLDIRVPLEYTQPLVVAAWNYTLSIQLVNAKSSKMIKTGENAVKYIDAYPETDVEQIRYPNKLKESLILKGPKHPDRFEYKINIDDFLWEIAPNGDILFKQKEKQERFEINEIKGGYIKATMNTDYTDGHPAVFRIPEPFLIEGEENSNPIYGGSENAPEGAVKDKGDVEVKIEKDRLILIPDQEWLDSHQYPIILDPTVESVPREQNQVVIGDEDSEAFEPKLKLYKWGDETYVSVKSTEEGDDHFTQEGDKIVWHNVDKSKEYNFYPEENNFEYKIILKQKPDSNVIGLNFESQGLSFYYQPEISDAQAQESLDEYVKIRAKGKPDNVSEELWQRVLNDMPTTLLEAKRKRRPENVVGSYAVYHSEKRGDYTQLGGKNYRAGKAFHIYRPKVIDSAGNWTWGVLNIDEQAGILTVTIDQDWLDNAAYPVRHAAGLTFGSTNEGLSQTSAFSTDRIYAIDASPASDGTGDDMRVYFEGYYSNNHQCALYNGADTITNGITNQAADPAYGVDAWVTFTFPTAPDLLSATTYRLAVFLDANTPPIHYDTGTGYAITSGVTYNSWPSGASWSAGNGLYSIYTSYTAGAANATPTISSVTDSPDPVTVGSNTTFTTTWADDDANELGKIKICKTDVLSSQNCSGGFWASSTDFVAEGAVELTYTAQSGDVATSPNNYFAYVCDDEAACVASGSGTAGTFSVILTKPGMRTQGQIRVQGKMIIH